MAVKLGGALKSGRGRIRPKAPLGVGVKNAGKEVTEDALKSLEKFTVPKVNKADILPDKNIKKAIFNPGKEQSGYNRNQSPLQKLNANKPVKNPAPTVTPSASKAPKPESEKRRKARERLEASAAHHPSGPTIEAGMDDRGFYDNVARHTQAGYQNSEDLKNVQKAGTQAWSNLKGKDSWQSVAGAAGIGAVAGGLTGAGINTLRGEDAWDGAKSGAFMGAVTMGGIKGVRTATGATAKQTMGEGASAFNQKTGLTKSVKSIFDNERNAKIAKDFMKAQQASAQ